MTDIIKVLERIIHDNTIIGYFTSEERNALTRATAILKRIDEEKIEAIVNSHCSGVKEGDKVMLIYSNVAKNIIAYLWGKR